MSDVISFGEALAIKNEDCKLWSAKDNLESVLRDIKDGVIDPEMLAINYITKDKNGVRTHGYSCSGVSRTDYIALLELAKTYAIQNWMED